MSVFYYFLPDCKIDRNNKRSISLEEFGLAKSLDGCESRITHFESTYKINEETVSGVFLFCAPARPTGPFDIKYNPKQQQWIKLPVGERFVWIGWDKENPPTPETLERNRVYDGYKIPDASDNQWAIPIARGPACSLPMLIEFDLATEMPIESIDVRFDELWKVAGEVWDHWNSENTRLSTQRMAVNVLKALQVNYHVGPAEIKAFQEMGKPIFNTTQVFSMSLALIDLDIAKELKKKIEQIAES